MVGAAVFAFFGGFAYNYTKGKRGINAVPGVQSMRTKVIVFINFSFPRQTLNLLHFFVWDFQVKGTDYEQSLLDGHRNVSNY
jgi:hypothetical protein